MSSENKAFVRYVIEEVFNQRNFRLVTNVYAPDFRGESPYGPIGNRDAFKSLCEEFAAGFPDFFIRVEQVIAENEWVVVIYTFIGTNSGPFAGFSSTGCVVESQGVLLTRIVNNRISEQSFVWDDLRPRRRVRQSITARRPMAAMLHNEEHF